MIHGIGKGPGKQRSIQVPIMIENILKTGRNFRFWRQVISGTAYISIVWLPV
jgi:hypothetical protein